MIPRMLRNRLTFSVGLASLLGAIPLPSVASERAIITAPSVPPPKVQSNKKQAEAPSNLGSFKSGNTGVNLDAIPLPTVPSIDPKAARQLRDRIEKEKDWLLEDGMDEPVSGAKALEEAWELGDTKTPRKSAIERRLRGKDRESGDRSEEGSRDRDAQGRDGRSPRRGKPETEKEEEDGFSYRGDRANAPGFNLPGEKSLNPFEAANKTSFNERMGGHQGGIFDKSELDLGSSIKAAEADYVRRMERLGLTGSADSVLKDPAIRVDALGQERQMRVDQFTQALGGTTGNSLSGLASSAESSLALPSLAKPATPAGNFFDKPLGTDLVRPFAAPAAASGTASRANDFLRNGGSGFAPLPRTSF